MIQKIFSLFRKYRAKSANNGDAVFERIDHHFAHEDMISETMVKDLIPHK